MKQTSADRHRQRTVRIIHPEHGLEARKLGGLEAIREPKHHTIGIRLAVQVETPSQNFSEGRTRQMTGNDSEWAGLASQLPSLLATQPCLPGLLPSLHASQLKSAWFPKVSVQQMTYNNSQGSGLAS
jgi:hypothetical protein